MVNILMNNGKEYKAEEFEKAEGFIKTFTDENYKIIKDFITLKTGEYINTNQIVEVTEKEEPKKQEINFEGNKVLDNILNSEGFTQSDILKNVNLDILENVNISPNLPEIKIPDIFKK